MIMSLIKIFLISEILVHLFLFRFIYLYMSDYIRNVEIFHSVHSSYGAAQKKANCIPITHNTHIDAWVPVCVCLLCMIIRFQNGQTLHSYPIIAASSKRSSPNSKCEIVESREQRASLDSAGAH